MFAGAVALAAHPAGAQTPPAPVASAPAIAPTPIPVLAAPTDTPEPAPAATVSATPAPRHRGRHASQASSSAATSAPAPTPTPTAPGFATLDGTWEVQLQHADSTDYSYLDIHQSGTSITGAWRVNKTSYPFDPDSTYDGKLIRIIVKTPKGQDTFAGYVENGTDMVGILDTDATTATGGTPFTAGHRGRDKGGLLSPGLTPAGIPVPGSGGSGTSGFPH